MLLDMLHQPVVLPTSKNSRSIVYLSFRELILNLGSNSLL